LPTKIKGIIMEYKSVTLEVENLSMGDAEVQVDVYYYTEQCECDTDRGVERWEENVIDHVEIVKATIYDPASNDTRELSGHLLKYLTFTDVSLVESEVATYMCS
jgi:hypothetical protein